MTNTNTTKRFFGLLAFAGVLVALSVPAAVSADSGTPTDPTATTTTTTVTTTTTPAPVAHPATVDPPSSPFSNPKNWTNVFRVKTQYGPICHRGKCSYLILPGSLVQVYGKSGKVIKQIRTNRFGTAAVILPKGQSQIKISHAPAHGYHFGVRTFVVQTPIFMNPMTPYLIMTFCVAQGC